MRESKEKLLRANELYHLRLNFSDIEAVSAGTGEVPAGIWLYQPHND